MSVEIFRVITKEYKKSIWLPSKWWGWEEGIMLQRIQANQNKISVKDIEDLNKTINKWPNGHI